MLISQSHKSNKNFIALIAIIIAFGNGCFCIRDSFLDVATPVSYNNNNNNNNNNLELNDNEVYASLDVQNGERAQFPRSLNLSEYSGELCDRVCISGQRRVCYFEFFLEYYQAMGVACRNCSQGIKEHCNNPQCIVGDGVEKGVLSINRQIPGPAIQICQDDWIIVDVHNQASGTAASIHWHGLHMVNTPHMDGVPFLTQCPIPFATSFRYQYSATEAGTQFYHSHSGHHKVNGQYGALIVRRAMDPLAVLYDYDLSEHYILISDWMHSFAEKYFPGLPSSGGLFPDSVLINGRGVYRKPNTEEQTEIQPTIYYVTPGKSYRFRLINSVSHACPFQLQIEKHNLTVISTDSHDVQAITYDTLVTNSGERYDFILKASHTKGDFWLRVRGIRGGCSLRPLESYAVIRYNTSEEDSEIAPFPNYDDEYPSGKILNHPNATCWGGESDHCVTELTATEYDEDLRHAIVDEKHYLSFQNYLLPNNEIFKSGTYNHFANINSNLTVVGAINNFTFMLPDYPPLTQPESIDESQFCDSSVWPAKCSGRNLCPCVHRIKVKRNSVVELIIVDESTAVGRMHHPFHLHGYRFMVTGMGQHPNGVPMTLQFARKMEESYLLARDYFNDSPPFKDTVSIPSAGYAIVRFRATNPGFWMMHCHYEWHLAIGMGLILQVGELSKMVRAPSDFPKCGNYLPNVQIPGS